MVRSLELWWAFLLYIISFIGCLYYFISSRIAKRTLALSLEKERFEKQQIEQLNQEKLVFFTNVSHLSSLLHKKSRLPAAKKTGEYRVTTSDLSQPHG
jgi:hypothetical protein